MTPAWLLHTTVARDLISGRQPALRAQLLRLEHPRLGLSVISQARLLESVARLPARQQPPMLELLEEFFRWVVVLPWDGSAASRYARLRVAHQAPQRSGWSDHELMLAAHALALELPLVSGEPFFDQIQGLRRVSWI
jgi:predicted nucleic acid-binding protein